MDLGAFLTPGLYPVFTYDGHEKTEAWGHLLRRPGRRIAWLARLSVPIDSRIRLAVELHGFALQSDGSLISGKNGLVFLFLTGRVSACRLWVAKALYLTRLDDLIRLLD